MMTVVQQELRLLEEVPGITPREARARISRSVRTNCLAHTWQHLVKRAIIAVEAPYNTGTVAIVAGGTAITLAGGVWSVGWSTAPSNRRIVLEGRPEPYDITITGAATGVLSPAWGGATLTAGTYTLYRDLYPLPADCDYGRPLRLYDRTNSQRISFIDHPTLLDAKGRCVMSAGYPRVAALVGQTTELPPRPQVELGLSFPAAACALELWYYRTPPASVGGAEYPAWPEAFEDMIWLLAAIEHAQSPRSGLHKMLAIFQQRWNAIYYDMKGAMDGGSYIDRQIQGSSGDGVLDGDVEFNVILA